MRKEYEGSCIFRKPVEGNRRSPGLVVGAQRFTGKGLEVLGEATDGELFEGRRGGARGSLLLSGSLKGVPQQPGDHRPDRTAQVGARVEPGLLGTRARRQRP